MHRKFSKNDIKVIKSYELLTDNQLDLIKGGITASATGAENCTCISGNRNRGSGTCTCSKGSNSNYNPGATVVE